MIKRSDVKRTNWSRHVKTTGNVLLGLSLFKCKAERYGNAGNK